MSLPVLEGPQEVVPRKLGNWEQRAKTSKKDWKWQRGIASHPLAEGRWKNSHLTVRMWESEKHAQVGASQSKVSGTALPPMALCWELTSKWSACGWSVVQLDQDEEMGTDVWDVMDTGAERCSAPSTELS